jgi:D-threo-aldose 1-dehydrogenase
LAQALGLAAGRVNIMMPLLRDGDFDAPITHNRLTLVNLNAEEMMDYAQVRGIAVLIAAPYRGGVFGKCTASHKRFVCQEASPETLEPIARIEHTMPGTISQPVLRLYNSRCATSASR